MNVLPMVRAIAKSAATRMVVLLALILVASPPLSEKLGAAAANFMITVTNAGLSRLDAAALERGYYEDLTRVDRFNGQLWEVYAKRPADWLDVRANSLSRLTGDFRLRELAPSSVARTSFSVISTNSFGMRDQEYAKVPLPGTFRVGLLGASMEMGWGVEDDETFESVLERRLNDAALAAPFERIEILNFAVAGATPLQQMAALERALTFDLDVVLYMEHPREFGRTTDHLASIRRQDIAIPYPYLRDVAVEADVAPGVSQTVAERRLAPFADDVLLWAYQRIVTLARDAGAVPVWLSGPRLEPFGTTGDEEGPRALELAEEAGFEVLRLDGVYEGHDQSEIVIAEWDRHPNALGHRLIAHRLYELVSDRPDILPLVPAPEDEHLVVQDDDDLGT
jgi:hypothetical protein